MFQRGINEHDVRAILTTGETIEEYPGDIPYPSRLIIGWIGKRPIHIVAADNVTEHEIIMLPRTNLIKKSGVPNLKRESHEMCYLQIC